LRSNGTLCKYFLSSIASQAATLIQPAGDLEDAGQQPVVSHAKRSQADTTAHPDAYDASAGRAESVGRLQ